MVHLGITWAKIFQPTLKLHPSPFLISYGCLKSRICCRSRKRLSWWPWPGVLLLRPAEPPSVSGCSQNLVIGQVQATHQSWEPELLYTGLMISSSTRYSLCAYDRIPTVCKAIFQSMVSSLNASVRQSWSDQASSPRKSP